MFKIWMLSLQKCNAFYGGSFSLRACLKRVFEHKNDEFFVLMQHIFKGRQHLVDVGRALCDGSYCRKNC